MNKRGGYWKPKADLIIRPRKTTMAYRLQILKVSSAVENNLIVLVWSKWPAKLITDIRAISGVKCFSIARPKNFFYVCKMGALCQLKV